MKKIIYLLIILALAGTAGFLFFHWHKSPKNQSAQQKLFHYSYNASWKTPYGILAPDSLVIKKLSDQNLAAIEDPPFGQEQGVSGIVVFIKKSLPNAKVIPLIFNNRVTLE